MANEIKYSPNLDINKTFIQDVMPENVLRVYPYKMVNWRKDKVFIQPNTISVVSVSQDPFVNSASHDMELKFDADNSAYYFEALGIMNADGVLDISQATSIYGVEFKYESNVVILTNDFKTSLIPEPLIATLKRPLNIADFEDENQEVFVIDAIQDSGNLDVQSVNLTQGKMTLASLSNINSYIASVQNARIKFVNYAVEDKATGKFSGIGSLPTYQAGNFGIQIPKLSLFNNVKVRGNVNGNNEIINVSTDKYFIPVKATCVDIQDKTTLFLDWFDYNVAMPMFIAREFIFDTNGGKSLNDLNTLSATQNAIPGIVMTPKEINVIKDMILVSNLYSSSFAQCERFKQSDHEVSPPSGQQATAKAGDLRPDWLIGTTGLNPVSIEGKQPQAVIDGIFEKYLRDNPTDENTIKVKVMKQIMCALSRYINSTYTIGQGQNAFNQVYLPWFLTPSASTPIQFTNNSSKRTYELNDIKFRIDSRWFDIDFAGKKFTVKKDFEMSTMQLIQTDRQLTIPQPSDYLQAMNKLPLPGDIATNTSDYLMYNWYIPSTDQEVIEKFYLNTVSPSTLSSGTKTQNKWTYTTNPGTILNENEARAAIIADIARQGIDPSKIIITSGLTNPTIITENVVHRIMDYFYWPNDINSGFASSGGDDREGLSRQYRNGKDGAKAFNTMKGIINATYGGPEYYYGQASGNRGPITSAMMTQWLNTMFNMNSGANGTTKDMTFFTESAAYAYFRDPLNSDLLMFNLVYANPSRVNDTFSLKFQKYEVTYTVTGQQAFDFETELERKKLFDKFTWKREFNKLIVQSSTASTGDEIIICKDEYDTTLNFLEEIDITLLWADSINIIFDGIPPLTIKLFSQDDDSMVIQRIIFA